MEQQLTFFDAPESKPNKYRLFLAFFPTAEAVNLISEHQINLRNKFGLTGRPRPRNHLHITLHHIGDYPDVPNRVVAKVTQACTYTLACKPSFEVAFNHVMSFRGRPDNLPFVLVNPGGNFDLINLHQSLVTGLIGHQLAKPGDLKFVPQVTMLYDRLSVRELPVRSVKWAANEVMLILSHLGATKYERLGCWELGGCSN